MSPNERPTAAIDIYIRVSQVGGREGESFISPQVQEERCRAFLAAGGYSTGKVFTDLDKSGRNIERPQFEKAMQRALDGVSGGIVVWKLSRFARNTRLVLDGVEKLEEAGAVLLSTAENLDTSSAMGRFVLGIFAGLAELESETIREGWALAHGNMLDRGFTSGPAPVRYVRGEDKVLVTSEYADTVRELFAQKAAGKTTLRALACWATEAGLPTRSGDPWTATGYLPFRRSRV